MFTSKVTLVLSIVSIILVVMGLLSILSEAKKHSGKEIVYDHEKFVKAVGAVSITAGLVVLYCLLVDSSMKTIGFAIVMIVGLLAFRKARKSKSSGEESRQ